MSKARTWANVAGYEGSYEVSNDGLVRNAKTGKLLKFSYTYNGYQKAELYKRVKGKLLKKAYMVHRLVATAFIENTENKPQVNHIDGCKTNNCVNNLEWCTQSENLAHSVRIGLRDMSCCTDVTKKKVAQYDDNGTLLKLWDSMSDAGRSLKIPVSNISHCCSGKIKHAGGYIWSLDY